MAVLPLFVSQRFDRIETRCFECGIHPEEDADRCREADADRERPPRQRNREAGDEVHAPSRCRLPRPMPSRPPSEVRNAASIRNWNRISRAARAERLAHADLARPLGDRDRHDRHHADAADHQRDRRDHDQREERALADLIPQLQEGVLRERRRSRSADRASGRGGCASRARRRRWRRPALTPSRGTQRDLDRQERRAARRCGSRFRPKMR